MQRFDLMGVVVKKIEMNKIFPDLRQGKDWIIPFVAAVAVMFAYAYTCRQLDFRGDALDTWKVAKSYWSTSNPFRSYVEYRGFLFFTINALIFKLSEILGTGQALTLRFFGSLLFAAMSALSLPTLISRISGVRASLWKRMACVAIVFYFFRGHFLYPSSDAISFWFVILAINAAMRGVEMTLGNALLSGLWIGCAVLCRGNLIVALPSLLILAFRYDGSLRRPTKARGGRVFAILVPFVILLAINSWHQAARTKALGPPPLTGGKVLSAQLTLGMKNQRLEWRLGGAYPGQPSWVEPTGRRILEMEGKQNSWLEPGEYLSIVSRHPLDFAGMYARHLFNGLDIAYPAVYVPDVLVRSMAFSLLNYMLIFCSIVLIARDLRDRDTRMLRSNVLIALFLPALVCVPFQIEPRFFISMGMPLLVYPAVAATRLEWHKNHRKAIAVLFSGVLFVAGSFAYSAYVFKTLEGSAPLPFHTLP